MPRAERVSGERDRRGTRRADWPTHAEQPVRELARGVASALLEDAVVADPPLVTSPLQNHRKDGDGCRSASAARGGRCPFRLDRPSWPLIRGDRAPRTRRSRARRHRGAARRHFQHLVARAGAAATSRGTGSPGSPTVARARTDEAAGAAASRRPGGDAAPGLT